MRDDRQVTQSRSAAPLLVLIRVVQACFVVTIVVVVVTSVFVDPAMWWLLPCVAALAGAWTCVDFYEADGLPQKN